jgi:hypothetical protein
MSVAEAEVLAAGTWVTVFPIGSIVFVGCGLDVSSGGDTAIVRLQAKVVIMSKEMSKTFVFIVLYPFGLIIVIK